MFIFIFGSAGSLLCARGLSLVAPAWACHYGGSPSQSVGSRAGASVVAMGRLRRAGSVVVTRRIVSLQQEESSQSWDRTPGPCVGREILNHQATRKAADHLLLQ